MNDTVRKLLTSSAVIAVLLAAFNYAGRYLVGQEVQKQVNPVKAQLADILFEKRYEEAQAALKECLAEHPEHYCKALDEWRWDEHYPYLDCIAGVPRKQWVEECGPKPEPPPPPEED